MRFAKLPEEAYADVHEMVVAPIDAPPPMAPPKRKTAPPVRRPEPEEDSQNEGENNEAAVLQQLQLQLKTVSRVAIVRLIWLIRVIKFSWLDSVYLQKVKEVYSHIRYKNRSRR